MFNLHRNIKSVEDGKFIDFIRLAGYEWETYEITEQLNGIDFEFWVFRNGDIKMLSRDQFVGHGSRRRQLNYDQFTDWYYPSLLRIKSYTSELDDADVVIVYGKSIGLNITQDPYYGTQLDFVAIDLVLLKNEQCVVLPPIQSRAIVSAVNMLVVPRIIVVPCLQDALDYEYKGSSKISNVAGFQTARQVSPWGFVIRPHLHNIWLPNGRQVILEKRVYRDRPTINPRYWVRGVLDSAT